MLIGRNSQQCHPLPFQIQRENVGERERDAVAMEFMDFWFLERESKPLLSRFTGDPTVEILRSKKKSRSTHRGLRVGSGFGSFRQTSRGRGFILLGFTLCLSALWMVRLIEALNGRLIGPKTWDRSVRIY